MGKPPQILLRCPSDRPAGLRNRCATTCGRCDHERVRVLSAATPRLVGRDDALRRLVDISDRVALGSPTVAVLSGETGIGKTALLRHFVDAADVVPVLGSC